MRRAGGFEDRRAGIRRSRRRPEGGVADSGIQAAHIAINTWIGDNAPEGIPSAAPEQIAPVYWDLYEHRDQAELVFNG